MRPAVIYLDVDEVLVDWVSPVLRLLGHDPDEVLARWSGLSPRPWDLFDVIDTSSSRAWWAIDNAGASFWASLEKYPWADELIALCQHHAPTVLLTSPSKHPSSHAGKAEWIAKHFGRDFREYLLGSCKHRVAHPRAVLIDDSPKNCDAFYRHGGRSILFPGVGNNLHATPGHERVAYVADQLRRLRTCPG
jgi:5'(3')-deoxyribonucleotidase